VKQQQDGLVRRAGFPIEDVEAFDIQGAVMDDGK
jgi:hypothetical protein